MKIISFSLDEKSIELLERLKKNLKISNTSELIRKALISLDNELKRLDSLKGYATVVITCLRYENSAEDFLHTKTRELKADIISHLHQCIDEKKSIELFVVKGSAENLREFYYLLQSLKSVESISLTVLK